MSWDVAVRAVLDFDSATFAKWPAQKLKPVPLPKTLPEAKLECATVGAALKMLEKRASYSTIMKAKGKWTLWAVLSEDDWYDHAPTLLAAMARAGASSATGEVLLYGYLTAPEGMAHRVDVGPELTISKLSKAEEKKLLATREAKAFDAWVEKQLERDEEAAAEKRARARSKTPSKFFEGMKEVRPVIEDAMDFIQRADDKALAKVVAKGRFYRFYAKKFKTGRIIKAACTPASQRLEDPVGAASDMLGMVHALDPAAAEGLCARLLEVDDMPDVFRRTAARILHRTAHARRVVERLGFRTSGVVGGRLAKWELSEWAGYLADSADVPTALLEKRLRASLPAANNDEGAGQLVAYLAAALLTKRQAWDTVPELARACYTHPSRHVRTAVGQIFTMVSVPVPIDAPRLDELAVKRDERGYTFVFELCRRLRTDPSDAFDELHPLLLAKDHTVSSAVACVLGPSRTWQRSEMTPAEQDAVFAVEPRWKSFRTGVSKK